MSDPLDEFLDEGDEGESGADDGGSDAPPPATKGPKSTDKRVADLQSKADKETARANKAEAQLKALLKMDGGTEGGSSSTGASAPEVNVALDAMLDMARMFAVQQNPRLAEYGLGAADLNGTTPAEIAASAAELITRFEKIETRVRNKVLADNGYAPEIDQSLPSGHKPVDYSTMSSEDFQKVLDRALSGR